MLPVEKSMRLVTVTLNDSTRRRKALRGLRGLQSVF